VNDCSAHLLISGLVQGVGYRYFCLRAATRLGLTGWARNNPNGTVEVQAYGNRSAIEELIKELKVGPFSASVRDMKVDWGKFSEEFKSFTITG